MCCDEGVSDTAVSPPRSSDVRPWALVGLLAATFTVAGLGSLATISNVDGWYADADKPWFTPPSAVFGPVWTTLYALMAVAAWLALRRGVDLTLWWVQLALNLAWTPVFFAAQWLWGGVAVIVALDVVLALTILRFRRASPLAAALLLPYLAWVLFATALSVGVASMN